MEFQLSCFKSWKMMLWKCCIYYASKFVKLSSGHRTARSVFIPIPKKGNAKECSDYCTIALLSHASNVTRKILQSLQQYVNHELPDVQAGFRKCRGTRGQIANICWIIEKARELRKTSISVLLTMESLWLCGSPQTVENSERDGNTRPPDLPLEKSVCRSGSNR